MFRGETLRDGSDVRRWLHATFPHQRDLCPLALKFHRFMVAMWISWGYYGIFMGYFAGILVFNGYNMLLPTWNSSSPTELVNYCLGTSSQLQFSKLWNIVPELFASPVLPVGIGREFPAVPLLPPWENHRNIMGKCWEIQYLLGALEPWNFMTFHWECHHPTWRSPSFFGGVGIPPTRYGWKFMGKSSSSAGEHFPATFDENLMIRYRLGCLQSNYIN